MSKLIAIKVEYNGKIYMSEFTELTPEEEGEMIRLVKAGASGELSHLTFSRTKRRRKSKMYFPEKILKESIISLEYKF